eukprot:318509_1
MIWFVVFLLNHLYRNEAFIDFYIEEWNVDNITMPYMTTGPASFGGFDNKTDSFYLLYGIPVQSERYQYFVNDKYFKPISINTSSNIGVFGQAWTTFVALNGSSYTFGSFWDSTFGMNNTLNFWKLDMENGNLIQIGIEYPKPYDLSTECYANDGKQYIYLIGGAYDAGYPGIGRNVSKFDIINNKWIIEPKLNIPRSRASCIFANDQLFVFGGNPNPTYSLMPNEVYNISSPNNEWIILYNSTTFSSNSYHDYSGAVYP